MTRRLKCWSKSSGLHWSGFSRLVHDQAIAEQLAQETLLCVYRSRHKYAANAKFATWLYQIAAGIALNHLDNERQERTKVAVSIEPHEAETSMTLDVHNPSLKAEHPIVSRGRMEAIRNHMDALPDRQRFAVLLHRY